MVIVIVVLFFRRVVAWAGAWRRCWPRCTGSRYMSTCRTRARLAVLDRHNHHHVAGPMVLEKIEGIDKPALGSATFDFNFTRTVNKSVGFLPCWYSATFHAVARASATVDLDPVGRLAEAVGLPLPAAACLNQLFGAPGQLAIAMALPLPQLPQSVHDVSIDNTLSQPVSSDHSWTYPGIGCVEPIQPQFAQSVLYAQAQTEAYQQATTVPKVTGPLVTAAEKEAAAIIRDNFIVPTVGGAHYYVASVHDPLGAPGRIGCQRPIDHDL